jgi:ubiquinone/menaquinone biosynthesis C-methylase UbiE
MPSLPVLKTMLREIVTRESSTRIPEPDLVMDDPAKVAAFTRAGREDGVMAPVYLFHCAQICDVIRAGETVVDLGCGPATQLAMVARLNPRTRFMGIDLSDDMLARARSYLVEQQVNNVELRKGNICTLDFIDDKSIDAVFSTVAFHHLPDIASLDRTFAEVGRILKPGGGIYLVDFGHLKSEKSILQFAYQYADRQPELFTLDYLYSLRAAFNVTDFRRLTERHLREQARVYANPLMPYMVAVKSASRLDNISDLRDTLRRMRRSLPAHHRTDVSDLIALFLLGGLNSRLLSRA